jgi:Amt family ammonium transporter
MMQSFILMVVATVMWALFGYSLSFGDGNSFIGDMRFAMMNGVGMEPNTDYAATIPHLTWMAFQMMFAIITPASSPAPSPSG